jgi:hypothetical protein
MYAFSMQTFVQLTLVVVLDLNGVLQKMLHMEKFVSLLAGGFGEREFTIVVIVSVRARCLLFIGRRVTILPNLILFSFGKTRKKCVLSAVLIGLTFGIRRSAM